MHLAEIGINIMPRKNTIKYNPSLSITENARRNWRFRSKGPQKTDDYFGVKPPKKDSIINKKGRELGSRASNFRSIATQFS